MNFQRFLRDTPLSCLLQLAVASGHYVRRFMRVAGLASLLATMTVCIGANAQDDDAARVSTVETSRTDGVPGDVLVQGIVVDAETGEPMEGFRVLPGVPFGGGGRGQDPACATWQPHLIREAAEGAFEWPRERTYRLFQLRIEADGYVPVTSDWIIKDDATWVVTAKMLRDPGIRGRVLTPEGELAAGATLAIGLPNRTIRLDGKSIAGVVDALPDKLGDRWRRPVAVQADDDGQFTLPTETDPAAMLCVLHESGYLDRPFSQILADHQNAAEGFRLQLAAWGHIAGEVVWRDRPGPNEPISLSLMRENIYPELIASFRATESDGNGRFEFANVPPGRLQLSRSVKIPGNDTGSYQFPHAHLDVKPGEPTVTIIGGRGVPVVGELTGLDSYTGTVVRIQPDAPHFGFPGDDAMWKGYAAVQASEIGPVYFRDAQRVNDDGTFRIHAVLPGDYQLFIANEDRNIYKVHSVRVPTEGGANQDDQPIDVGRIAIAERAVAGDEPPQGPNEAPDPQPVTIRVRGTVVDDETGEPIEAFIVQAGKFDPAEPEKVTWGFSETRTTSRNREANYSSTIRWSEGWTARILADGYLPQPILTAPPPEGTDTLELTIRLKRGRLISGRVLDHLGRPVAGATVFAAGRGINLFGGKAYGHGDEEDPSRVGVLTDEFGGFEIAAGDSTRLAVSSKHLDAWAADLPEEGDQVAIVLPEPARVEFVYDIEGGDENGQFFYQWLSHDVPELSGVNSTQTVPIENGGRLELSSLPPGKYQFWRSRTLRIGRVGHGASSDRQFVELEPGEAKTLRFVRPSGQRIRGVVTWPEDARLAGIIVSVRSLAPTPNPVTELPLSLKVSAPELYEMVAYTTYDARLAGEYSDDHQLKGADAPFLTERIPPGNYVLKAEGYEQQPEGSIIRTGGTAPTHTVRIRIEVPENGDLPQVELRLEPGRGRVE